MSNWSLFVKNPVSDAEKSITGTLGNKQSGSLSVVFGTVMGLPKPFTTTYTGTLVIDGKSAQQIADIGEFTLTGSDQFIFPGPTSGPGSGKYANDNLLNEMAGIIDDIYGTTIGPRLVWEPAPEEPKQEEEEPQTGTQSTPQSTPQSDPELSNKKTSAIVDPKSINTKITLSVKSGPGVIIGITEKEVVNGEIDFSGLQFDKPGDYIIAVTPTSPDLDSTEFPITVLPEDELIEQDDSGEEEEQIEGDRPIIAQIRKPEVILPPIEYETTDNTQQNKEMGEGLGFVPFLWYNSLQIPESDIKSLELYHEGISPTVTVSFKDTLGIMKAEGAPLDDTKFEIFLNSGSENLKSIHLKFKIKTFQRKRKNYTISGSIDLPKFYEIAYKSYTGTSFDTFDMISKELKLGFNSNINSTKDSMKWVNTGMLFKDFVSNIIKHSYISDNAFVLGYIDHYWCFNYVDIEKEWNRDISTDIGVDSSGLTTQSKESDASKLLPLILTNEQSQQSNNLYFSSHKISNNSTNQSLKKGQFTITKYYNSSKKIMEIFKIDSLTTKNDAIMPLKGAPGDEKSFKENYRTNFLGRVDMDNVHENYLYSETQNRINLDNMVKITAELQLPQPNFNIYKYQKIQVNFTNTKRTPQTEATESYLDERMSGEWLIIDIRFSWKSGKLTQKVKIARKELGKLKEELETPTSPKEDVDNAETNDNPAEEPKPNEVYNVGETYKLIDKDGKIYELIVSKLSDDGKEVDGELIDVSERYSFESETTAPSAVTPTPDATPPTPDAEPTIESTGNYGKMYFSGAENPLIVVFGGIDVAGDQLDPPLQPAYPKYPSGVYMPAYFESVSSKYNIWISNSDLSQSTTNGNKAYQEVNEWLDTKGISPPSRILYAFSGGYGAAKGPAGSNNSDFSKVYLVDIWMGGQTYWPTYAKNNTEKVLYFYTSFGCGTGGQPQRDSLISTLGYPTPFSADSVHYNAGHMGTNKKAIATL